MSVDQEIVVPRTFFLGPAEYNIPRDQTHGPSYSFGTRLKENIGTNIIHDLSSIPFYKTLN